MRRFLTSAIAVLALYCNAYAQEYDFKKGSSFIEGGLSYNLIKDGGEKQRFLQFNPSVGYFVNDKLALGATTNVFYYYGLQQEIPEVQGVNHGIFGRYYFFKLGERFKTYAQLKSGLENIKITVDNNGSLEKEPTFRGFNLTAGFGANYFITPKWAISLHLSEILYFHTGRQGRNESTRETTLHSTLIEVDNNFSDTYLGLTFKF